MINRNNIKLKDKTLKDILLTYSLQLKIPKNNNKDIHFKEICDKINQPVTYGADRRRFTNRYSYLAAASIVFFALIGMFYFNSVKVEYIANYGEQAEVVLPDGSKVYLNSGTTIEYKKRNWKKKREIYLAGEAFFEVTEGNQFRVVTENGMVKVYGTSFNIFTRQDDFIVTCYSGEVGVNPNEENQEVRLTKKYRTELRNGVLTEPYLLDDDMIKNWMDGFFQFNSEDLTKVFQEIERQFNVKIRYSKQGDRRYTGDFTIGNLEEVLTLVCKPMGLEYEIKEGEQLIVEII